ncbi:MAG: hypothetical protein M3008_01070, partial [Chloroflexota bacterium]|nr:hypothetical protein [Chloroflexota bacterium]
LDWAERVMTGDALPCDRDLCATITHADGDVKEKQATLRRAITTLFASCAEAALRAASLLAWDMRATTTCVSMPSGFPTTRRGRQRDRRLAVRQWKSNCLECQVVAAGDSQGV